MHYFALFHEIACQSSCEQRNPTSCCTPLQAFLLYEDAVSDQRARITALHSIVGTLHCCHCFGRENWEVLVQVSQEGNLCVVLIDGADYT